MSEVMEYEETSHRKGGKDARGRTNRHRPFASVLVVALLAVPALAFVLRLIAVASPGTLWLSMWLTLVLFGLALPLVSLGIGFRVTRRLPGVVWHVFSTMVVFGTWLSFTIIVSQDRRSDAWYWRLWDAIALPGWWWVLHILGSLAFAASWLLYRIDAFRSAAGVKEGSAAGLAAIFGKGVTARMDTVKVTDTSYEIELDHPNVPQSQVRQGLAKVNDMPGVIAGSATVVREGDHGGRSKLTVDHRDPFADDRWEQWPGLSHPGETYEHPLTTAKYKDGTPQWFSFAKTPDGITFAKAPEFRSPGGVFLGRQGMTGAGKSGDACIEEAEVASRRDVVLVHVAPAKLKQNAGWLIETGAVKLVADANRMSVLFRGLKALGEYRDSVLEARDFTSQVAAETGRPWIHVFADEFDIVKQGSDLTWLLTKGRSVGLRFSFTLPRSTAANMDPNIRGSIGAWKQFGLSQSYDAGFVISQDTIDAGANEYEKWAARVPGAHYLDGAPGVAEARYPMKARTYRTREDYADLKQAVIEARAMFEPMDFPDDEKEVLGDVLRICDPMRELDPIQPATSENASQKGLNMEDTLRLDFEEPIRTGDADFDEELANLPSADVSANIRALLGHDVDHREPIQTPDTPADGFLNEVGKPRATPEEGRKELDAALVRMAGRGVKEFTNKELADEMRVKMSGGWVSDRLKGLASGEFIPPEGITLERVRNGVWKLIRL